MKTTEIWKSIVGYEGLYEVSDHGRVKSLARKVAGKGGSERLLRERVLAAMIGNHGYEYVNLYKEGTMKTTLVHRLVAETFVEQTNPEQTYVNHINGIKTDNHASNLEWTTHRENLKHASDTGLNQKRQWRPVIVNGIEFESQQAAADYFGFERKTLNDAINRGATTFKSRGVVYHIGEVA